MIKERDTFFLTVISLSQITSAPERNETGRHHSMGQACQRENQCPGGGGDAQAQTPLRPEEQGSALKSGSSQPLHTSTQQPAIHTSPPAQLSSRLSFSARLTHLCHQEKHKAPVSVTTPGPGHWALHPMCHNEAASRIYMFLPKRQNPQGREKCLTQNE